MTDTSSRRRRAGLALVLLAGTSLGGFGFRPSSPRPSPPPPPASPTWWRKSAPRS